MEKLPKIKLPEDYTPSEDEEYMGIKQLEYFSLKLQSMLAELETQELEDNSIGIYYSDEDSGNEKLIKRRKDRKEKIKEALEKIKLGNYGYCDGTGEEIFIYLFIYLFRKCTGNVPNYTFFGSQSLQIIGLFYDLILLFDYLVVCFCFHFIFIIFYVMLIILRYFICIELNNRRNSLSKS